MILESILSNNTFQELGQNKDIFRQTNAKGLVSANFEKGNSMTITLGRRKIILLDEYLRCPSQEKKGEKTQVLNL